jgi:hypothetical protein
MKIIYYFNVAELNLFLGICVILFLQSCCIALLIG